MVCLPCVPSDDTGSKTGLVCLEFGGRVPTGFSEILGPCSPSQPRLFPNYGLMLSPTHWYPVGLVVSVCSSGILPGLGCKTVHVWLVVVGCAHFPLWDFRLVSDRLPSVAIIASVGWFPGRILI